MIALAAAAVVCAATPARAGDSNGLRVADGRVHPSLEVEGRYDTAAVMVEAPGGVYLIPADLILHLRPGVQYLYDSSKTTITLRVKGDYALYTGMRDTATRSASHPQGEAEARFLFNKDGRVAFGIGDVAWYREGSELPTFQVGVLALGNEADAKFVIRPAGALEIEPSYRFVVETYQGINGGVALPTCDRANSAECDPNYVDLYDNYTHHGGLLLKWRLFPKTHVFLDPTYWARDYVNTWEASKSLQGVAVSFGASSLLTGKSALSASVGWSRSLYTELFSAFIGKAEFVYMPLEDAELRLGVSRSVLPTAGSGVAYRETKVLAKGLYPVAASVALRGMGWISVLNPFLATTAGGQTGAGFDAGVDYDFKAWLQFGGGIAYQKRTAGDGGFVYLGQPSFTRTEAYFKTTVSY